MKKKQSNKITEKMIADLDSGTPISFGGDSGIIVNINNELIKDIYPCQEFEKVIDKYENMEIGKETPLVGFQYLGVNFILDSNVTLELYETFDTIGISKPDINNKDIIYITDSNVVIRGISEARGLTIIRRSSLDVTRLKVEEATIKCNMITVDWFNISHSFVDNVIVKNGNCTIGSSVIHNSVFVTSKDNYASHTTIIDSRIDNSSLTNVNSINIKNTNHAGVSAFNLNGKGDENIRVTRRIDYGYFSSTSPIPFMRCGEVNIIVKTYVIDEKKIFAITKRYYSELNNPFDNRVGNFLSGNSFNYCADKAVITDKEYNETISYIWQVATDRNSPIPETYVLDGNNIIEINMILNLLNQICSRVYLFKQSKTLGIL